MQQIGDITNPGLVFHHCPCSHRNGGGVGVLSKTNLKVKVLPHNDYISFEYMEATLKAHVHLVVVYHPPPSAKNKSTVPLFMSEFASF